MPSQNFTGPGTRLDMRLNSDNRSNRGCIPSIMSMALPTGMIWNMRNIPTSRKK